MLIFVSSKTFLLLAVLWTGSCGQDIGAIYNAISDGTTQSQSQCADGNTDDVTSGSIIPCSRSEDPYSGTRDVYNDLMGNKDNKAYSAETESRRANNINKEQPSSYSHSEGLATTKGITSGIQALSTWATGIPELTKKLDIGNKVGTFTNAIKEVLDGEQTKKLLKKGLNMLKGLASCVQFLGPVLDLVMLFIPASKSAELKAIEKGAAETEGALKAMSVKLDQIEDTSDFNAIVSELIEFEGSVSHGMDKFMSLQTFLDENDPTQRLSVGGKSMLEDLINYVRGTGNIGKNLNKFTRLILKGSELYSNSDHLLTIFRRSQKNDCSKILGFGYKMFGLIKDAQKLQFLYEMNQGLVGVGDDNGYPRDLYDINMEISEQYIGCNKEVSAYALTDVKILRDEEKTLDEIKVELEKKYSVYQFSFLEENDKENIVSSEYLSSASMRFEVPLDELTEDDKKKKALFMYITSKSASDLKFGSSTFIKKIANSTDTNYNETFLMGKKEFSNNTKVDELLGNFRELLKKENPDVWPVVGEYAAMALIFDHLKTDNPMLTGWDLEAKFHILVEFNALEPLKNLKEDIAVIGKPGFLTLDGSGGALGLLGQEGFDVDITNPLNPFNQCWAIPVKLGFLFNLNLAKETPCEYGRMIYMTFDQSMPFCMCDYGWGGDACDISTTAENPEGELMESVLSIASKYKVPGMFDLEDTIQTQTESIIQDIEDSKNEIFTEIRSLSNGQQSNKNAIMSAQSVILNELKSETGKILDEFSNLKTVMQLTLKKDLDDRIYRSEKATSFVVNAIAETSREMTDQLISLDKKIVENRYFDELSLYIPVFLSKFSRVTKYNSTAELKEGFSEFLEANIYYLYVSREAVSHAITGQPDSYLRSQMNGNMARGCTGSYTDQIKSVLERLLELHAATYTIEIWNLAYRLKKAKQSNDWSEVTAKKLAMKYVELQAELDSNNFKKIINSACPTFVMEEMLGGGCKAGTTYRGQTIKNMQCIEENLSLVLLSSEEAVHDLQCGENGNWSLDVTDLACAENCMFEDVPYPIGGTRDLPAPRQGFRWADEEGGVVAESVCKFSASEASGQWSSYEEVDIDECEDKRVECGEHGSCTNTEGSFTCNCPSGFVENGVTGCEDVNECKGGDVGSIACLSGQSLGLCNNTVGGYECVCLPGAYLLSGTEQPACQACGCEKDGVTEDFCNRETGVCHCKDNVAGHDCESCAEGYTNYPYCNKCNAGYHGFPDCQQCACSLQGTTSEICNARTGKCSCNKQNNGPHCGRCCPGLKCEKDFSPFPECTPIIKDGKVSEWEDWGGWVDQNACDSTGRSGYNQKKTRQRRCDDKVKNRHGKSCKRDILTETFNRFFEGCKQPTGYMIKTACGFWDATSGKITFEIKQGDNMCTTSKPTINKPGKCKTIRVSGAYSCLSKFDPYKPMYIRIVSDSYDGVKVLEIGVSFGEIDKVWKGERAVDKGDDQFEFVKVAASYPPGTEKITGYYVHTFCKRNSASSAKLRFKIIQDDTICESSTDTISSPMKCKEYHIVGSNGCDEYFDPARPLKYQLLSDSWDDVWVQEYGIELAKTMFKAKQPKGMKVNKKGAGKAWREITP